MYIYKQQQNLIKIDYEYIIKIINETNSNLFIDSFYVTNIFYKNNSIYILIFSYF